MSFSTVKDALLDTKETEINGLEARLNFLLTQEFFLTKLVEALDEPTSTFRDQPRPPILEDLLRRCGLRDGTSFNPEVLPSPTFALPPSPTTASGDKTSLVSVNPNHHRSKSQAPSPLSPAVEFIPKTNGDPAQLTPASASTATLPAVKSRVLPPHTPPRSPQSNLPTVNEAQTPEQDAHPNPQADPKATEQATDSAASAPAREPTPQPIDESQSSEQSAQPSGVVSSTPAPGAEAKSAMVSPASESSRVKERVETTAPAPANDTASSPSSTAGAYSTSTPKPPHHSPDTSPEAETLPNGEPSTYTNPAEQSSRPSSPVDSKSHTPVVDDEPIKDVTPESQLRSEEAQAQRVNAMDHAQAMRDVSSEQPKVPAKEVKAHIATPPAESATPALSQQDVEMQDAEPTQIPEEPAKDVPEDSSGRDIEMADAPTTEETSSTTQPVAAHSTVEGKNQGQSTEERPASQLVAVEESPALIMPETQPAPTTELVPEGKPEDRQESKHEDQLESKPGRMRTRVASGAIRQKSVSEILGGPPKKSSLTTESPKSAHVPLLEAPNIARKLSKKSKSTVVFTKQVGPQSTKACENQLEGYLALKGASLDDRDYLRPLFLYQAHGPPREKHIPELIRGANKAVTTADFTSGLQEMFEYKVLRKIYQLQDSNKWSLRQMAKFQDPYPGPCHWDSMMDEMKWLQTDFREERRWKQELASVLANACATWHATPTEERHRLQVKVKTPYRSIADSFDVTPALTPSKSSCPSENGDEPNEDVSPAAIFSLSDHQVIFHLDHTPSSDALLGELPFYDPKAEVESPIPLPANNMDAVSKLVMGKLVPKMTGFPRKRSRFEYEESDEEPSPPAPVIHRHKRNKSTDPSPFLSPARRSTPRCEIPPEEQEVALFNVANKHILDRMHATHAFRPPNEFPMPTAAYFEARPQSQWLWDDDQKLRHAVRKYQYNWSLIAMDLQQQCQPSNLVAGVERRTPWECFERWVQLEGLPQEMSKTPYFKAYQGRLEVATRSLLAQAQAAQQLAKDQPPTQAQLARQRRTSHQPMRVDRRRDTRHISMIDIVKKLAKRREIAKQRQEDNAKTSAMRKMNQPEQDAPRPKVHTPQEMSKLKQEREATMREKQAEAMRHKMAVEQQRMKVAALQQQQQSQNNALNQQHQLPASQAQAQGQTQAQAQAQNLRNSLSAPNAQMNHAVGQARAATNGMTNGASGMQMNGLTQQQLLQAQAQGRIPQNADMTRLLAMQRQQHLIHQQQMAAQNPQLAAAHLSPSGNMSQQQQMMNMQRNMHNVNGLANGTNGATQNGSNMMQHQMQLSPAHQQIFLALQNNIRQRAPQLAQEQVAALAREQLKNHISAAAMNVASGGPSMQNQNLAQQHLGMQSHSNQMMAAFAAAQNSLGGVSSPMSQAATAAQNGMANGMGMTSGGMTSAGMTAAGMASAGMQSPSQAFRNVHTAQQAARLSGSPGMMPAQAASRSATPNGMVRSASGASGSPVLGQTSLGR